MKAVTDAANRALTPSAAANTSRSFSFCQAPDNNTTASTAPMVCDRTGSTGGEGRVMVVIGILPPSTSSDT